MRRDAFSHYHPIVNMLYFVLVIGAGMALRHGVCQVLGLVLAFSYCIALEGSKVWKMLRWLVPLCLCSTVINMFVSHEGVTVLFTLWGVDITMESTLYGLSSAVMLMTVILWFRAFSVVITTDKFLYLFGRIVPALSLVVSMTLRFVPLFGRRLQQVREAQRTLGYREEGTVRERIARGAAMLSVLVTWSLEKAIDTGDAMKSRGYGLQGRTTFDRYTFEGRDVAATLFLVLCAAILIAGGATGQLYWQYYPYVTGTLSAWSVATCAIYALGCGLPLLIKWKEEAQWRSLTFDN